LAASEPKGWPVAPSLQGFCFRADACAASTAHAALGAFPRELTHRRVARSRQPIKAGRIQENIMKAFTYALLINVLARLTVALAILIATITRG
jgi:hypothetical protein